MSAKSTRTYDRYSEKNSNTKRLTQLMKANADSKEASRQAGLQYTMSSIPYGYEPNSPKGNDDEKDMKRGEIPVIPLVGQGKLLGSKKGLTDPRFNEMKKMFVRGGATGKGWVDKDSGSGHVYYNIVITNTTTLTGARASYTDNRSAAVVTKPSKYKLSIVRFSLPTGYLPIFIYPNNLGIIANWPPNVGPPPNPAPNNLVYSVTLSFGGSDYQTFLQFVPSNLTNGATAMQYESWYEVHSYQQFMQMINTALLTSYNAMKTANPTAPNQAPYLVYNTDTLKFSFIVPPSYIGTTSIYFNVQLNNYFNSFEQILEPVPATNGKDILIQVVNNKNNMYTSQPINIVIGATATSTAITSSALFTRAMDGATITGAGIPVNTLATFVTTSSMTLSQAFTGTTGNLNAIFVGNYLSMEQEWSTLVNWNDLKSIVLTSSTLPIRTEYLPSGAVTNGLPAGGNSTQTASNNFIGSVSDFVPDVVTGADLFTNVTYTPTAQYRYVDLIGDDPILNTQMSFFWSDSLGNLRPIFLPLNTSATIKILFEKKSDEAEKISN